MPRAPQPKVKQYHSPPATAEELIGYKIKYTSSDFAAALEEMQKFYADDDGNPSTPDSIINNEHRRQMLARTLAQLINVEKLSDVPDDRQREIIAALAQKLTCEI